MLGLFLIGMEHVPETGVVLEHVVAVELVAWGRFDQLGLCFPTNNHNDNDNGR